MAKQKIAPCPTCGLAGEHLSLIRYESGWHHVECDRCHYMGPGEGKMSQAIKSHNERCAADDAVIAST